VRVQGRVGVALCAKWNDKGGVRNIAVWRQQQQDAAPAGLMQLTPHLPWCASCCRLVHTGGGRPSPPPPLTTAPIQPCASLLPPSCSMQS
jgi:hypothetical protein